jgi:hypothetical protein
MSVLPFDLWHQILSYVDFWVIWPLRGVSTTWYAYAQREAEAIASTETLSMAEQHRWSEGGQFNFGTGSVKSIATDYEPQPGAIRFTFSSDGTSQNFVGNSQNLL